MTERATAAAVLVEQRVPLQRQMAPKGRASETRRDKARRGEADRDRGNERERDERRLVSGV